MPEWEKADHDGGHWGAGGGDAWQPGPGLSNGLSADILGFQNAALSHPGAEVSDRSAPMTAEIGARAPGESPLLDGIEGFNRGFLAPGQRRDASAPMTAEIGARAAGASPMLDAIEGFDRTSLRASGQATRDASAPMTAELGPRQTGVSPILDAIQGFNRSSLLGLPNGPGHSNGD